jgi:hypothetical protein
MPQALTTLIFALLCRYKIQVSAYASGNPDFAGACGRCYEVKCAPGAVLGWGDKPVNFRQAYFPFWWYANVTDENGRGFPGGSDTCNNKHRHLK